MSNRIFPNWDNLEKLKNPLTAGENHLLKFLDENLPKDPKWKPSDKIGDYDGWLIFAQPYLNGSRPDIIILNPYVGMMIYEVKDWNLKHYHWEIKNGYKNLCVTNSRESYSIKNPIDQVLHYKNKIIQQLVPKIGELIDQNNKNYGLIKTALYFHNADNYSTEDFFNDHKEHFKYFPIFGNDRLLKEHLHKIVPDIRITKSRYWKREWNDELIFWLKPPFHSIEQGKPLTLKGNQRKVAETNPGHHRVRGIAGSGKTQALAYRAAKLASQNYDVLIISYNITLWHYIRDMISRAPFGFNWGKITFNHFHGFCRDKINEFGQYWPKSPEKIAYKSNDEYEEALENFFRYGIPQYVKNLLNGKNYDKYDAILIDEGQDYYFEWYKLLTNNFLKERDELLVVCDKKQNIYDRELDWIDKRVTKEGLEKFKDPYIDLTTSFRMPDKVVDMSNEFSQLFNLNQDIKISKKEYTLDLFSNQSFSQHIVWRNIDAGEWLNYIHISFQIIKKDEHNPSDLVILLPSISYGKEAVNFFKSKNIEVNHVFEDEKEKQHHPNKKAFWMGDSRLKISTIHSFKGWELKNIVLFIPKKAPESNKKLDSIVYTALTRTRQNLIVLNANNRYKDFGEKFPKKWKAQ